MAGEEDGRGDPYFVASYESNADISISGYTKQLLFRGNVSSGG